MHLLYEPSKKKKKREEEKKRFQSYYDCLLRQNKPILKIFLQQENY